MNNPSLPPADLSGAFAPPRAVGLHLPTAPKRDEAQAAPPAEKEPFDPVRPPEPRSRPGRPRTSSKPTPLVFSCPVSLRVRMKAVQSRGGTRYLDQVLDALEACVDEIDEIVAATGPETVQGPLFEREVQPRATPEARVQVTIRGVKPEYLATIDQLVQSSGAESRSALLSAVLDRHLPKRPRAMR